MADISRADMMEAISDGILEAIPILDADLVYNAIRQGVADGIWRIATNGGAENFDVGEAIRQGVEDAIDGMNLEKA
jgi:hypothetical protein